MKKKISCYFGGVCFAHSVPSRRLNSVRVGGGSHQKAFWEDAALLS